MKNVTDTLISTLVRPMNEVLDRRRLRRAGASHAPSMPSARAVTAQRRFVPSEVAGEVAAAFVSAPITATPQRKVTPVDDPERQLAVSWLTRMGAGEEAALAEFYQRYSPVLYGMALKMLTDEHESQDVLQEAIVHIWRKAASYNSQLSSPFTWAVMILRGKAIDRLRSRQRAEKIAVRVVEATAHLPDVDDCAANEPLFRERRLIVRSALCRLNDEQRQALELAFFSGLTHEAIATLLATPLGTIKTRIRRALIQMRDLVADAR